MGRFTKFKDRILPKSEKRRAPEATQPNKNNPHLDHTAITQESFTQEPIINDEPNNVRPQPGDSSSPSDLWQCAFEQLEQKERDELKLHSKSSSDEQIRDDTHPNNMVEQVIETTKDIYEDYQKTGGLRIKTSTGDVDLRKVAGKIINAALSAQDLISKGVGCDPTGHAAIAWAVISLGLTMTQNHNNRRNALFDSAEYLTEVLARCAYCEVNFFRSKCSDNEIVRSGLIRVYKAILQYTANVKMAEKQGIGEKLLDSITAITSQRLGQNQSSIEKAEQELYQSVQLDNFRRYDTVMEKILTAIDDKVLKSVNNLVLHFGIPIAEGAVLGFYENERDSVTTCLEDTRVEVLLEILAWAESSEIKFFWLNGMAGTGKSTLARTVAKSFQDKRQLGAVFFFKKDDAERGNAKRFISTIAKQLMSQSHQLASLISDVVNKDSQITSKALSEQFRKLLLKPLQDMTQDPTRVIVIVVDALDECAETDLQIIFRLLPELQKIKNIRLKIFLTGRPEREIFQGIEGIMFYQDRKDLQELALHEVEESVIEHDIRVFLRNGLEIVREKNPSLRSTTWPTDDAIAKLVTKSVPLFIYAATVCRFIGDGKQLPQKRLDTILQSQTPYYVPQMQIMYQVVLEQLLNPEDETDSKRLEKEFKDIVGVIVLLAAPLSVHALGGLLPPAISTADVRYLLENLRSVLSVPAGDHSPVSILHESFREFLLRPGTRFFVDKEDIHGTIVSHCLHVMNQYLKRDICNLQHYGIQRSDIGTGTLSQFLPPELQYSCRYWVYHLEQSRIFATKEDISENDILGFLRQNFLHWLEAMSLMGAISETIHIVDKLMSLKQSDPHSELSLFVFDAKRFIFMNKHMADTAPLQLYCSGLIFSPKQSIVRELFEETRLEKLHILPCVEQFWGAAFQTLEGHSSPFGVNSVAFSPNGQIIASCSSDMTVRLWDAKTGQELQTLQGHSYWVQSVAFSPDGQRVASGSRDNTSKLWDINTGQELQTISHPCSVESIAFSPDGDTIALGLADDTITLWDTKLGQILSHPHSFKPSTSRSQDYDTISPGVQSIAFSPDGQIIASGSDDKTIKLWDAKTGKELQILQGHSGRVQSVAFSPDGRVLASGSDDRTIKFWDATTCQELQILKGHSAMVFSVAFSPDGQIIASGSYDKTIKLWDTKTGNELQTFTHSDPVTSVAFSPDGQTIASGLDLNIIKLWDIKSQALQIPAPWSSSHRIICITFSSDGQIVASGSLGGTIKLWDTKTGKELQALQGHSESVTSVAFSPDGKMIVSGSYDKTIKFWDIRTGQELQTIQSHSRVNSVAFSPDNQTIASAGDLVIRLWDTKTGQELQTIQGHSMGVYFVAFSPNGQILASNSSDRTTKLWDIKTGEELHSLLEYSHQDRSLAFSPDGKILRTSYRSPRFETTDFWDVETGKRLQAPGVEADSVASISDQGLSELDLLVHNVSIADGWVAFRNENLLWLPAEYRHPQITGSAIQGDNLALGYSDGRVVILGFRDV
ncbi:hypothetical protein N7528_008765 [Penicillium herquei]|nr:hypothetical protein N7528_008765 [Penicillium herquei]